MLCLCGCGLLAVKNARYHRGHRPKSFTERRHDCACGCGMSLPPGKYPSQYIRGHGTRGKSLPNRIAAPSIDGTANGYCQCGCGRLTAIATYTDMHRKHIRGAPMPYLPGHGSREPKAPICDLTPTEAAYLAGIVDGEGSLYLRSDKRGPTKYTRIIIGITSIELIEWLREKVGGNPAHTDKPLPKRSTVYRWQVSHHLDCATVLRQIIPYLVIKRAKAQEMLDFISQRHPRLVPSDAQASMPIY